MSEAVQGTTALQSAMVPGYSCLATKTTDSHVPRNTWPRPGSTMTNSSRAPRASTLRSQSALHWAAVASTSNRSTPAGVVPCWSA